LNTLLESGLKIKYYCWPDLPLAFGPSGVPYEYIADVNILRVPFDFDPAKLFALVRRHGGEIRMKLQLRKQTTLELQRYRRRIRELGVKQVFIDPGIVMHPLTPGSLHRLEMWCASNMPMASPRELDAPVATDTARAGEPPSERELQPTSDADGPAVSLLQDWTIVLHRNVASELWLDPEDQPTPAIEAPAFQTENGDTDADAADNVDLSQLVEDADEGIPLAPNNANGSSSTNSSEPEWEVNKFHEQPTAPSVNDGEGGNDAGTEPPTVLHDDDDDADEDSTVPFGYLIDTTHARLYIPADFTAEELSDLLEHKREVLVAHVRQLRDIERAIGDITRIWKLPHGLNLTHASLQALDAQHVYDAIMQLQFCATHFLTKHKPPARWKGVRLVNRRALPRSGATLIARAGFLIDQGDWRGASALFKRESELVDAGFPSTLDVNEQEARASDILTIPVPFNVSEFLALLLR